MRPGMIAEIGAITATIGGRCWLYSGHIKLKWSSVGCYKHQTSGGVFIIMWSWAPLIHCTKVALVLHSTYFFIIARKNVILHLPINSKQIETNIWKSASYKRFPWFGAVLYNISIPWEIIGWVIQKKSAYLFCNDFSQGSKNLSTGGLGSKIWLIFGLYMYDAFMDIDLDG